MKTVKLGKEEVTLVDTNVPAHHVDMYHELWIANGICGISFCALVLSGELDSPVKEMHTQARVRMPLDAAKRLHKRLGDLFANVDALSKPAGTTRQ